MRHPLQRHKPADVVGEVLQADLGFRPHDTDRPYNPTTRRCLLSTEHVLDASPNLAHMGIYGSRCSDQIYIINFLSLLRIQGLSPFA